MVNDHLVEPARPAMDPALIARAKSGDRAAMEELLGAVAPSIRRFALRMCRSAADADDVLQDALVAMTQHIGTFEGRSTVPSWAFAITRSACSRRRRGQKNQPLEREDALAARAVEGPSPEEETASHEHAALVANALDGLSDEHREVLLLRDVEGLTAPEAAVALGVSVDALKSRLHRARGALREALRPVLEAEAPAPSSACPDVVRALSRKLEDDLGADLCAEMERHVAGCAACARTCDAMHDVLRACRATSRAKRTPAVDAQVRAAVNRWLAQRP